MKKRLPELFKSAALFLLTLTALVSTSAPVGRTVNGLADSFTPYQLDVNNDGIKDFYFRAVYVSGSGYADYIIGLNGSTIEIDSVLEAENVPLGNQVGTTNIWNDTAFTARNNETTGNFGSQGGQGYAGLKFTINGNVHYGWAKLYQSFGSTLVQTCGYETTPNTAINAGEGFTSIGDLNGEPEIQLQVFPNPASNELNILLETKAETLTSIFDLQGKMLAENHSGKTIPVGHLPKGVYTAEVKTANGTARKRWIKM